MMVGGSLLLAAGCAVAWVSLEGAGFTVLMLGLFAAGAGIALPYACAPRIGLAALLQTQTGKGSGVFNSCSFLGGTVGVTGGGIVFAFAGFGGVLVLVGCPRQSARAFACACARSEPAGLRRPSGGTPPQNTGNLARRTCIWHLHRPALQLT
jgi:hypothetical protein